MFGFIGWLLGVFPIASLSNVLLRMWGGVAVDPVLVSIPMFIFMGSILERSGSAKDMLLGDRDPAEARARRPRRRRDGDGHDPGRADRRRRRRRRAAVADRAAADAGRPATTSGSRIGTIASAGTLGILIPPAIMLVVMAEMLNTSAGALFAAATMPGFLLSGLYLLYILVHRRSSSPSWAPKLPADFGPQTRREFWRTMWTGLFPMTFLMVVVLGSIFAGWATATESAGVGVLGSFIIAALNGRLDAVDGQRRDPLGLPRQRHGVPDLPRRDLLLLRVPHARRRRPHGLDARGTSASTPSGRCWPS